MFLQLLICNLLSMTVSLHNHHSAFPHPLKAGVGRSIIKNWRPRLEMRERNERKTKYENYALRKADHDRKAEIPIYIISNFPEGKPAKRSHDSDEAVKELFDENGMIYLTQPKEHNDSDDLVINNLLHDIVRRSADGNIKIKKKLMSLVNEELNKRLLAINERHQ